MKTTIEKIVETDAKTLVENYNETIELIKEAVEKKGWRITGELKIIDVTIFIHSSKSSRKKFRDRLNRVLFNPTIRNINTLRTDIKVKISEKEETIQNKRKAWKVAKELEQKFLLEYKEEKGSFYKR